MFVYTLSTHLIVPKLTIPYVTHLLLDFYPNWYDHVWRVPSTSTKHIIHITNIMSSKRYVEVLFKNIQNILSLFWYLINSKAFSNQKLLYLDFVSFYHMPTSIFIFLLYFLFYFVLAFLTFLHYKMFLAHLVYFLLQSWNLPYFQEALLPLSGEWY